MTRLLILIGVLSLLNACGVAEGPAFLRIEGRVLEQNGYPVVGKEIQVRLQPEDLDRTPKSSEGNAQAQTNVDGRFSVEKSRFAGGMLIIPMALLVAPFSGLIAAVTPLGYWDVQEFFSPVYLIGSYCLPHPVEINMSVGSLTNAVTFSSRK